MPSRVQQTRLDDRRAGLRYALRYAFYDWTREMPRSKRVLAMAGILIQGFAIWAGFSRSLIWPVIWPRSVVLLPIVVLLYYVGHSLQNAMLASELVRKTQLESDQIAARQIQQTLQPTTIDELPGYDIETFYKPLRAVGGDYFDVIALPRNRALFAVADVSGKGMPAALLAANIQALVRTLSGVAEDLPALAVQINRHLCRYTPSNRFATAVFIVLDRESGELTYVNAGHNAPLVYGAGSTAVLEATGPALGWFDDATYEARAARIPPAGALLVFTDGLTDSIPDSHPEDRLRDALTGGLTNAMASLKYLVDPKFNEDDVTILLVRRAGGR
jgi:serine phosphatase RsbU (regulator of sigma subunit)